MMAMLTASITSDSSLQRLLTACSSYHGGQPEETLLEASNYFANDVLTGEASASDAAVALRDLPPHGASWLAVVLAATIERGLEPELTTQAVLSLLLSWLQKLPVVNQDVDGEESYPEPTPEQSELLSALPHLSQSLVAHLSRMPLVREELASDVELLNRLDDLSGYSHGITWIHELLLRKSGTLVLLHVPSQTGLRIKYENVGNCFHLFSLIQHVVGNQIPGAKEPNTSIAAAALGDSGDQVSDSAWWHYGSPLSATPDLTASIWGEASISSIPSINGEQVILLWQRLLESRSWDAGFFSPQLEAAKPNINVDGFLTLNELNNLLECLGIGVVQQPKKIITRPWWRFW